MSQHLTWLVSVLSLVIIGVMLLSCLVWWGRNRARGRRQREAVEELKAKYQYGEAATEFSARLTVAEVQARIAREARQTRRVKRNRPRENEVPYDLPTEVLPVIRGERCG